MPDTQQQWLEEQLVLVESSTGFVMPVDVIRDWAAYLASAWPSSPQGQAAKQMREALDDCLPVVARQVQGTTDGEPLLARVRAASLAARKAGLTP